MSLQDIARSQLNIPAYAESLSTSSTDLTMEMENTLPFLSATQLAQLESSVAQLLDQLGLSQAGHLAYALLKITQMKLEKAEIKLKQVQPFFEKVRIIVACHQTSEDKRAFSSCSAVIDLPGHLVSDAHFAMLDRLAQMPVILWELYGTDQYTMLSYFSGTNQNAADNGVSADTERLHCLFGRVDTFSDPGGYAEDRNLWKKQYDEAVIVSSWKPFSEEDPNAPVHPWNSLTDGGLCFMRSNPAFVPSQPCRSFLLKFLKTEPPTVLMANYIQTDLLVDSL